MIYNIEFVIAGCMENVKSTATCSIEKRRLGLITEMEKVADRQSTNGVISIDLSKWSQAIAIQFLDGLVNGWKRPNCDSWTGMVEIAEFLGLADAQFDRHYRRDLSDWMNVLTHGIKFRNAPLILETLVKQIDLTNNTRRVKSLEHVGSVISTDLPYNTYSEDDIKWFAGILGEWRGRWESIYASHIRNGFLMSFIRHCPCPEKGKLALSLLTLRNLRFQYLQMIVNKADVLGVSKERFELINLAILRQKTEKIVMDSADPFVIKELSYLNQLLCGVDL